MVTVSDLFRDRIYWGQNYAYFADVTLEDRTTLQFTDDQFKIGGCGFEYGGGASELALGVAIAKHLKLSVHNANREYDKYDFVNAEIHLYMKMQMENGMIETVDFGYFYVSQPAAYGVTVDIEAYDAMVRAAEVVFTPSSVFAYTVYSALNAACTQAGLVLSSSRPILNSSVVVHVPEGLTCRDVIGYCAMIAGGNAYIDTHGHVYVKSYSLDAIEDIEKEEDLNYYSNSYHVFNDYSDLTVGKDEIQITGVRTVIDNIPYNSGGTGYMLEVKNELISGDMVEIMAMVGAIGSVLIGLTFKKFSMKQIRYPIAEPGDPVIILPVEGGMIKSFITDISFDFDGYTELECNASDPMRNASASYNSPEVRAITEARKEIRVERNAREVAQEQLARQIESMSGLYETHEILEDQSVITYLHDKPTIESSVLVIKIGTTIGISIDGGQSYPYGMDLYNASVIVDRLYTVGLDADIITAGTLDVRRIGVGTLDLDRLTQAAQATLADDEQIIYISKQSGTTSVSGTTTWVTDTTGGNNKWTTRRPAYSLDYPVCFVAKQKKDAKGTVTCTTPVIDQTITVIDGGNIIAGSITTGKISVTDLNAFSATIGGFQIDTDSIHTKSVAITSNADNSVGLSSGTFKRTINGTERSSLKFAIGSNFGVTNTGKIYASDVDISGVVKASSGNIGGWTFSSDMFYKDTVVSNRQYRVRLYSPSNATDTTIGIAAINRDYTNPSSPGDWSWPFYVRYDGFLYSTKGQISGFHMEPSAKDATTADGGHLYGGSFYRHSGDGTYEYEVGIKGDASNGSGGTNWAFYVARIADGAKWNTTNRTMVFGVRHNGSIFATSADITGSIKATSGTIGADNATNKITIGTNATNASIYYGMSSLDNTSSNGFYIGADGIALGKGAFKVTSSGDATVKGKITATSGKIGKFSIAGADSYLSTGSGSTMAGMGGNQAFWAGGSNSNSAPFRVAYDGSFASTKGDIGGWKIDSNSIYSGTKGSGTANGDVTLSSSTFTRSIGGTSVSNLKFAMGANFGVTQNGTLYANNAQIYGENLNIKVEQSGSTGTNSIIVRHLGDHWKNEVACNSSLITVQKYDVDSGYGNASSTVIWSNVVGISDENGTGYYWSNKVSCSSNSVERYALTTDGGLVFKNTSGTVTATYPVDGVSTSYGSSTSGAIRFSQGKIQIAWKRVSWKGAINQAWGSGVYESSSYISLGNWYKEFSDTPTVSYGCHSSDGKTAWVAAGDANATTSLSKTSAGYVFLERGGSTLASTTWYIMVVAVGKYS